MKKILFSMMAIAIAMYACKKSDKGDTTKPVTPISVDSVNLLTDSLKVNHFKVTTKDALLPAPKGSTVVLSDRSEDTIYATNGSYAVIDPYNDREVEIAGFYVKVKGANSYFTLDYTQPVSRKKASNSKGFLARTQMADYDSVIAIKLPQNILPGSFTVEYEAYDASGNVSNKTSITVTVVAGDQASAEYKLLMGTWKSYAYGEGNADGITGDTSFTFINVPDSITAYFTCTQDGGLTYGGDGSVYTSYWHNTAYDEITFSAGSNISYHNQELRKYIDLNNSKCENAVYTNYNYDDIYTGKLAYDPIAKKAYLIFDNGGVGSDASVSVCDNVEITATQITMRSAYEDGIYEYQIYRK